MSAATAAPSCSRPESRSGALRIDHAARRASVADAELYLSEREFRLLAALAVEPDRTLTYEELAVELFSGAPCSSRRLIDAIAVRLRRKLELRGAGGKIVPRQGVGFQFSEGGETELGVRVIAGARGAR